MMNTINESALIHDYINEAMGIEALCSKYKIGKLKAKDILKSNNIPIKPRGGAKKAKPLKVEHASIQKYDSPPQGFHYIAICKEDKKEFDDYMNKSGCLTNYIKDVFKTEIPSLYKRHSYYKQTGNYWYEQWFDVVLKEDEQPKDTKKCPYCDWETIDIDNKSGVFEQHLKKVHGISVEEHIEKHPEDKEYFIVHANKTIERQFEKDPNKYVECKICGKKLARIDWRHLDKHNITLDEYKSKFGYDSTLSKAHKELMSNVGIMGNIALEGDNTKFTSKAETEIRTYIENLGIACNKDRHILRGKELDLFIPEYYLAIEYNGNQWHTESFGHKDRYYHLNKLTECNSQGIRLIQIFEDEYELAKEIVLHKITHILKQDYKLPNIMGRKCVVREITTEEANKFLVKNHIQGKCRATVYIGAFSNNETLIGVVCLVEESKDYWNLVRLATDIDYRCQGVASKMFKYFVRKYNPHEIKSFADRRWTIEQEDNLYTKLGFKLEKILSPDYKYYSSKLDRYKRFHKFGFRKHLMAKKYGLDINLTESEMAAKLKLDKIWDCGLFKYVWTNKKAEE